MLHELYAKYMYNYAAVTISHARMTFNDWTVIFILKSEVETPILMSTIKTPTHIKCKTVCHTTTGHPCQAFKHCPTSSMLSARIKQCSSITPTLSSRHNRNPATRPRRAIFLPAYRPSHHIPRAHHTEWSPLHLRQKRYRR